MAKKGPLKLRTGTNVTPNLLPPAAFNSALSLPKTSTEQGDNSNARLNASLREIMDIDDILAEVEGQSVPQEVHDHQALVRAWVNEKNAPEILPWPEELMERVLERIREQIELVEEQTGNLEPRANFRLIIIQTELERFKFLVRSFLRTRITKIDKYALHYLNKPEQRARMSTSEAQYAQNHQALLHAHYHSSFMSQFPANLQRLDDTSGGGISMVEQPDLDKAVFVRALMDNDEPIEAEGTDIAFTMQKGAIFVVRWSAVKERVEIGEAELL